MLAMVRPLTMMNDDVGYGEPSVTPFEHGSIKDVGPISFDLS